MLAEDGKKMSKKLQNYPDPMEVVEKYGADLISVRLDGTHPEKGNRTPEEAGMTLAHKPAQIGIHGKHKLMMGSEDSAWADFLYLENRTPQAVQ